MWKIWEGPANIWQTMCSYWPVVSRLQAKKNFRHSSLSFLIWYSWADFLKTSHSRVFCTAHTHSNSAFTLKFFLLFTLWYLINGSICYYFHRFSVSHFCELGIKEMSINHKIQIEPTLKLIGKSITEDEQHVNFTLAEVNWPS